MARRGVDCGACRALFAGIPARARKRDGTRRILVCRRGGRRRETEKRKGGKKSERAMNPSRDRKSTRLNSSHGYISYAVFCLKKKKRRRKICRQARPR